MRNYCLLVVGIFDLDGHCHILTGTELTNNDTHVDPSALPMDIHVCAGELLTDQCLGKCQCSLTQRAALVFCRYGNNEITVFHAVHMDVCDQSRAKDADMGEFPKKSEADS